MARTRATAVSALILAIALTGIAVSPFVLQAASASAVVMDPPPPVEGCDAGEVCDPEVTITQTITQTPEPTQPETTITKTVTKSPTSKPTTPKKTPTTKAVPTPKTSAPATTFQPIVPPPSENLPLSTPTPESTPEESVQLPTVASSQPPATPFSPSPSESPSEETQELQLKNAAPEFDQRGLTQRLSIPALVLVLLVLFAVLIYEGRLRRLAHAAAVRKAGPVTPEPHGYPAGPGYTSYPPTGYTQQPHYPGGTAYAPIISFVPVQTYPAQQPAYPGPQPYQQPYQPEPMPEPVVLHPDEFVSYGHEQPAEEEKVRGAFEPLVPPEPEPPGDIPSGGSGPYDATREMPLSPGSAAEPGDDDLFRNR
ncbi:hypothetical protein [Nonomuraea typhae]|uniref:hypothetical protein n=1 Tax=Nonomuraea typhae TaxID=2603600 RepID=UPI0012F7A23C|nr:hypothetical protein [Nonomuraea typhae]